MNNTYSSHGSRVDVQNEKQEDASNAERRGRKASGAFKTISEVADVLDVQQHVLRFWETKFSQIRPLKRGGGRRYYRPEDLELLKTIHHLLYTEGYTIKGVQKLLREKGKAEVMNASPVAENNNEPKLQAPSPKPAEPNVNVSVKGSLAASGSMSLKQRAALKDMLAELKALRQILSA